MVSWLPLAGIYWEDEMPEPFYLRTTCDDDRHQIYLLFGIRTCISNYISGTNHSFVSLSGKYSFISSRTLHACSKTSASHFSFSSWV